MIAKNWDELLAWAKIGEIQCVDGRIPKYMYGLLYIDGQLHARLGSQAPAPRDNPKESLADWVVEADWHFVNPPNSTWFLEESL